MDGIHSSSWMDIVWWAGPFLIHTLIQTLLSVKNPAALQFFETLKPVSMAPTTFVLPIHPLNGTHTQTMSQLSQGTKILL
jgi:hypothetical protein